MCGIAGYYRLQGSPEQTPDLDAMTDTLAHRGPDDRGFFRSDAVGLGMRRLSIIDLVGGKQPIANEAGRIQVVQNGEIYNYRDLRAELTARGHRLVTQSDTETLVHGYEEWGTELAEHLRGMFAFALWDADRERLLIARDHFGIKPLYFTRAGGWLLFGSEIKSLLCYPGVTRELDRAALDQYLSFLYIPAPRTIFEGIHELEPGHLLSAQRGHIEIRRYYRLEPGEARHEGEPERVERIRAAFEDSVKAMLVSDVPLGAFLSGGIDSSSIVAMARRHTAGPVKTFSIGFGPTARNWDELDAAARAARFFQTEHHAFQVEPNIVQLLPEVVHHFDQPFANPTALLMLLLARETRAHVKVALAGTGGDELFAGYPRYLGMQAFGYYRHLPRGLRRGLARLARTLGRDSMQGRPLGQRARRFFEGGALSFDDCYLRWLVSIDAARKQELYGPEMASALAGADAASFLRPLLSGEGSSSEADRLFFADMQTYLPFNQLAYGDRMSMAASLEVRVPFVDQRLVEAVKDISAAAKLAGGRTKSLFRKAMAPFLPPEILRAPKLGLNAPVALWFRNELKGWVHALLSPEVIRARGYFRPEPIIRLTAEQEAGTRDHSLVLWALIVFEVWQRLYLDRMEAASASRLDAAGVGVQHAA